MFALTCDGLACEDHIGGVNLSSHGQKSYTNVPQCSRTEKLSLPSLQLCLSARGRVSYSYSELKVVIRALSRPPCTGTLEWFESGPDIPEKIAAQTPSSSQSATNSRIAALPLKIVIWTGEGWRAGCVEGAQWMEDE